MEKISLQIFISETFFSVTQKLSI